MAIPTRAGIKLTTKQLQPGYPRMTRDDAGRWALEYLYLVEKSSAISETPAHNSTPPSPESGTFPTLVCKGADISPSSDPLNVYLRVNYMAPETGGPLPVGTTLRSSTAAMVERPVEELTTDYSGPQIAAMIAKGRKTAPYFSVCYRRRYVDSSFTWNQTNVVSNVGKLSAPTGMTSPTAGLWIQSEKTLNELEEGGDVEVEEAWIYDKNGWTAPAL